MKLSLHCILIFVGLLLVWERAAWGDLVKDVLVCGKRNSDSPEIAIAACTRVLKPGKARRSKLIAYLLLNRALQYRRLNLYNSAIADLTRASRFQPRNKQIYFERAKTYQIIANTLAAMRDYRIVLRLDPTDGRARTALWVLKNAPAAGGATGNRLVCARRPIDTQTIAACTRLIRSGQYSGRALERLLRLRGEAYTARKLYRLAIGDYSMAIRLNSGGVENYHGRGRTFQAMNRCQQAIADFSKALRIDPRAVSTYVARAKCFESVGAIRAAIRDYRRARKLDPYEKNLGKEIRRLKRQL